MELKHKKDSGIWDSVLKNIQFGFKQTRDVKRSAEAAQVWAGS